MEKQFTLIDLYAFRDSMRSNFRSGGEGTPPKTVEGWNAIGVMLPVFQVIKAKSPVLDARDYAGAGGKGHSPRKGGGGGGRMGHKNRGGSHMSKYTVADATKLLHKASNAYTPGAEIHKTPVDKIRGAAIGICNKLSRDNMDTIRTQLIELKPTSYAMVQAIVEAIFEKALEDAVFQDLFAEVCKHLVDHVRWIQGFLRVYEVSSGEAAENAAAWNRHIASLEEDAERARANASQVRQIADAAQSLDTSEEVSGGASGASASMAAASGAGAGEDEEVGEDMSEDEAIARIVALISSTSGSPSERAAASGMPPQSIEVLAHEAAKLVKSAETELLAVKDTLRPESLNRPRLEIATGIWYDVNGSDDDKGESPYGPFASREEAEKSAKSKTGFRRLILNACQKEFQKEDIYRELDEEEKADAAQQADAEARRVYRHGLRQAHLQRAARRSKLRTRLKSRMLSNIGFIGHLFLQRVANQRVIAHCTTRLVKGRPDAATTMENGVPVPDPEDAEAMCKLLCLIAVMHGNLEKQVAERRRATAGGSAPVAMPADQTVVAWTNTISRWARVQSLPSKVRFLCRDVLDAARRGDWKLADTHVHAKRTNVGKAEFHKAEAAKEREAELAARGSGRRPDRRDARGGFGSSRHGGASSRHSTPRGGRVKPGTSFDSGRRPEPAGKAWGGNGGSASSPSGGSRSGGGGGGGRRTGGGAPAGSASAGASGGGRGGRASSGTSAQSGSDRGARVRGSEASSRAQTSRAGASASAAARGATAASASTALAKEVLKGEALRMRIKGIVEETRRGVSSLESELAAIAESPRLSFVVGRHITTAMVEAKSEDRDAIAKLLIDAIATPHVDASEAVAGAMCVGEEMTKLSADGPRIPVFVGQMLEPLITSGAVAVADLVRACWVFGPSGFAFQTVGAAVAGVSPSVADLEAAGIAGVMPTVASPAGLRMQLGKAAAALGGEAQCATDLAALATTMSSHKSDPAASAAAALANVTACPSWAPSSSAAARTGFARAVIPMTCNFALEVGAWDPAATAACVVKFQPLFAALCSATDSAQCFDAAALWVACQMQSGDAGDEMVEPFVAACVSSGLASPAVVTTWASAARGRSEAVAKVASLISL